jgi:hypothetical protein
MSDRYTSEQAAWQETRLMRTLDWLEAHTPGGIWPWGGIWLGKGPLRGCSFHFASGNGGFAFGFPLPRWLPGFVRSYQIDGPKRFWRGVSVVARLRPSRHRAAAAAGVAGRVAYPSAAAPQGSGVNGYPLR